SMATPFTLRISLSVFIFKGSELVGVADTLVYCTRPGGAASTPAYDLARAKQIAHCGPAAPYMSKPCEGRNQENRETQGDMCLIDQGRARYQRRGRVECHNALDVIAQ